MTTMPDTLPSLEIAFDLSKRSLDGQDGALDSLDAKIGVVFGAASIVISLVSFAKLPSTTPFDFKALIFAIAVLAYFVSGVFCWLAYKATGVKVLLDPTVLLDSYAQLPSEEAKYHLVSYMGESFAHNRAILLRKARLLNGALHAAGAEIVFLVVRILLGI